MHNKNGVNYFIKITTHNNNNDQNYLLLCKDLRENIYYYAHNYSNIKCIYCDKIVIPYTVNLLELHIHNSCILYNDNALCYNCLTESDIY
jgi:ribosomal protein S27E